MVMLCMSEHAPPSPSPPQIDLAVCLQAGSGQSWSIGRKPPQTLLSPLLGAGDGLSGSHNKYESDASPGRGGTKSVPIKIICQSLI